jgi:hypothetical protein
LAKIIRFGDADWYGLTVVAVIGVSAWMFRFQAIAPRWTVGACAASARPLFCLPRAAVLWLQYQQAFGWAAFALGVAAFVLGRRWLGVFAIAIGIAAVVNFNATTGILGAALGLITWIGINTGRYGKLN